MGDIIINIPRHIYQGEQHPSFLQRGKSLTKKKVYFMLLGKYTYAKDTRSQLL